MGPDMSVPTRAAEQQRAEEGAVRIRGAVPDADGGRGRQREPDACFPNNWFSTHAIGEARGGVTENTLVLYPMKTSNRRGLESE